MKKKSLDLKTVKYQLAGIAKNILRFHLIIATLLTASFLILSIITVNNILTETVDEEYLTAERAKGVRTRFKDGTIEKINELKSRQENPVLSLPEGRRNPFVE